jgi:ubiquinone/menaquinone biosynthesis C-methylase UbiE
METMFGLPRGLLGRLGGRLMALEHRRIYRFVVDALAVRSEDQVLEIGCGSGAASALVAERAADGLVCATDPSPVMVAQARRRLRKAIEAGRARVVRAAAEELDFQDESFTAAFAVFSLHHWSDPRRGLAQVFRVLRPGGRLLLVEPSDGHGHGHSAANEEELIALLRYSGFADVEPLEHGLGSGTRILSASRPA